MDDEQIEPGSHNDVEQDSGEKDPQESVDSSNPENEENLSTENMPEEPESTNASQNEISAPLKESATKKMTGWLRKFLIGLVIVALIFAAGFIVSQIVYTSPTRSALDLVTKEKIQLQKELSAERDKLAASQNDLEGKKAELTVTQSDLRSAESKIEQLQSDSIFNRNLEELKYHVTLTRIALLNQDKLTARQALNLAQDNLDKLSPLLDTDNLDAVEQRLADAYTLSIGNIEKALEELRTLTENLERIPVK